MAIHGNRVAIGAPGDWRDSENPDEDQAWVHVFDLTSATPAVPVASLVNPRATTTWRSAAGFGAALALDADRLVAGAPGDDTLASNQGAASVYGIASVGIEVAGTAVPSGGSLAFGGVPVGLPIGQMVTVRNLGSAGLFVSEWYLTGDEAGDFALSGAPSGELRPARAADCRVTFTPAAAGLRQTGLRIASDDAAAPLYQIGLAGTGLSMAVDSDGDGMNDVAEYHYAPLGFDWQTADTARVAELSAHAADAGLFTAAEIQARHGGRPLLPADPVSGGFSLRLRFMQSTDLSTFTDLPATPEAVTVDAEGAIRFEFPAPDPAAFFRIGVE